MPVNSFCHLTSVFRHPKWEIEQATRVETCYGCFLPDLAGLARDSSAANLPGTVITKKGSGETGNPADKLKLPCPLKVGS
jgi:hypothetical protein